MEEQNMEIEESLSFTCLPDHIWEKTFSYSKNLKNLMLTCKYFNDLILKSRKLMGQVVLSFRNYHDKSNNRQKVTAILKSQRPITVVYVDEISYSAYQILDHFKKYIKEISFSSPLLPDDLLDILEMMQNLEKIEIFRIDSSHQTNRTLAISRTIKKAFIGNLQALRYMPEIENLRVSSWNEESSNCLKSYLETHTHLKKLKFGLYNSTFPILSVGSLHFKLEKFSLSQSSQGEADERFDNRVIDFIKSQAKNLKQIYLRSFLWNLNIIQELFDGMEELQIVHLWGKMDPQSVKFTGRYFKCPKMKEFYLGITDLAIPGFFEKFPNLELIYFCTIVPGSIVESAVQSCRNIRELFIKEFNEAFENATFPNLVLLDVEWFTVESRFMEFLSRHPKLTKFELQTGLDFKENWWKLPTYLPNLKEFKFFSFDAGQTSLDFEAATKDISRRLAIYQYTCYDGEDPLETQEFSYFTVYPRKSGSRV
jgi:hypothetical protein